MLVYAMDYWIYGLEKVMLDLGEIRDKIDGIDRQLVDLFEERMQLCTDVAKYKIETGKKVLDTDREKAKIEAVSKMVKDPKNVHAIDDLFSQIMANSRKMQYRLLEETTQTLREPYEAIDEIDKKNCRVVYQGVPGAYSYIAMRRFFGKDVNNFAVPTWRDAMEAVVEGRADYAVLPIENSTAGIVNEIYDLLVEFENYIVGEQVIPIEHCLLALPGTKMEEIKRVYSHPQSLMQSARYLSEHDWQQISMQNNAFAALKVAKEKDKTQAAIASEYAGETYGLEILEKGINDSDSNSTRFIIVTNQKIFRKNANKISLCLEIPHQSGSLYHILSHFIYNNLNMTKIESRPIPDRNWEYRFFIDFEGNLADSAVKNALRGLREEARSMKILGNY